jgi:hypothetical protein
MAWPPTERIGPKSANARLCGPTSDGQPGGWSGRTRTAGVAVHHRVAGFNAEPPPISAAQRHPASFENVS